MPDAGGQERFRHAERIEQDEQAEPMTRVLTISGAVSSRRCQRASAMVWRDRP